MTENSDNYVQTGNTTNNIHMNIVTTWANTFEGGEPGKNFIPTKVIFNPPATICFFPDGSKIVVKCADDEEFCEEEGVMACIIKKIFKSRNSFKKLVKNAYRQPTYGKDQWG